MTHTERIQVSLRIFGGDWGQRHVAAWKEPRDSEVGIVRLIEAAANYADYHNFHYDSKLGDDSVLGEPWANILRSVISLLNGELGRLDGGTLDALCRSMLAAEGFEE